MNTPAKVNLFLEVGALRPEDGRHEIRTLFLPLSRICDDVMLERTEKLEPEVRVVGRGLREVMPADNLVCRACRLFCENYGLPSGYRISLEKRIPVSGGLGGGSSDAAAVLLLLAQETGVVKASRELAALAVQLGADVPYFLHPEPAYALGIGEKLQPVELGCHFDVVVAYSAFPSPVAWAYTHCPMRKGDFSPVPPTLASYEEICSLAHNDLGIPLEEKFPLLTIILQKMREAGCDAAAVSGSGSSCFGICPAGKHEAVLEKLGSLLEPVTPIELFWGGSF